VQALLHYLQSSGVELLGVITGLVTLLLLVLENPWNWPIGIANNILYVVIFFQNRFYADMTLQIAYIVISAIGWYLWLHGGENHGALRVRRMPLAALLGTLAAGAVLTYLWSILLARINDIAPVFDAATAIFSIVAQYMIARKYIENWMLWIVIDVVSVWLYASKHLVPTAALYAVYIAFCVAGLIAWQRSLVRRSYA